MIKRYSFHNEDKAKHLVLELFNIQLNNLDEDGNIIEDTRTLKQILKGTTTSKDVAGIVLDVLPIPKMDENGEIIDVEHLTYDVDIAWKNEPVASWNEFEVHPKTVNHKFA